ncbi:hypothetical protein Q5P01_010858 [Channa striata]|uniref:Uncharacterized protein n=1 Tax=Channa striata TaxID=64152 RepID=A0AA88SV19_CHASR|nr:hypothetical protein Q5P01_010858 [Channa striata]
MDRSMVEEGSGLRLLEASSQSTKGLYSPYNASGSGSAYGSRTGSRTGSRSGSRRGSFDAGSDLPPVILVPLPQSLRIQHLSTDTQLASPLNLDRFLNSCHPQVIEQICH